MSDPLAIRRLGPDDWQAYRAIRHKALSDHPEVYASSAEDFSEHSPEALRALLDQMAFFGAVDADGTLVGIMAFDAGRRDRDAHRGWLLQVYVAPQTRGTGCARALLDAVINYARDKVRQIHLCVTVGNEPALRLYQRAGFVIYGTDPRFQKVNGRYYDEHMMVRFFDEAPEREQQ